MFKNSLIVYYREQPLSRANRMISVHMQILTNVGVFLLVVIRSKWGIPCSFLTVWKAKSLKWCQISTRSILGKQLLFVVYWTMNQFSSNSVCAKEVDTEAPLIASFNHLLLHNGIPLIYLVLLWCLLYFLSVLWHWL